MFNSVALDVFIGLSFVFLLYSLLASILQEALAKYCQLRALMLKKALRRLLQDSKFDEQSNLFNRVFFGKKCLKEQTDFVDIFYKQPSIKYLGEGSFFKKPDYLQDKNYSETIIRILRGANFTGIENQMDLIKTNLNTQGGFAVKIGSNNVLKIEDETATTLKEMVFESNNDIDKFREKLEKSFNDMMERTEGWYKRQTRLILSIIGLILAITFNIDSIAISQLLIKNKQIRDQVASTAANNLNTLSSAVSPAANAPAPKISNDQMNDIIGQVDNINKVLGLGGNCNFNDWYGRSPKHLPGWLLTAFAISLGATFWFDMLQKVVSFRQSGNKPSSTSSDDSTIKSKQQLTDNSKKRVG